MLTNTEEIYHRHIKPLAPPERLRLMEMTARDLAQQSSGPSKGPERSIMELHGLGREIWEGVDPQVYVSTLRDEWDRRS